MTCEIIATGSRGNAVLLNGKYLFDCGVSCEKLKRHIKQLQMVFLTHIHMDHFNRHTIYELHRRRPALLFACGRNLLVPLCTECGVDPNNVVLVTPGATTEAHWGAEGIRIQGFDLIHNVENMGYAVEVLGGDEPGTAMYATDTQYIPVSVPGLDLYMLECNHTVEELRARRERKLREGRFIYEDTVAAAHMSAETVNRWLQDNAGDHSQVVFLHQHIENEVTAGG